MSLQNKYIEDEAIERIIPFFSCITLDAASPRFCLYSIVPTAWTGN